jgi:HSP20 family protein
MMGELGFGDVVRGLSLPAPIEASKIEASVENGVLTVIVPKAEEAKPKKIAVKAK